MTCDETRHHYITYRKRKYAAACGWTRADGCSRQAPNLGKRCSFFRAPTSTSSCVQTVVAAALSDSGDWDGTLRSSMSLFVSLTHLSIAVVSSFVLPSNLEVNQNPPTDRGLTPRRRPHATMSVGKLSLDGGALSSLTRCFPPRHFSSSPMMPPTPPPPAAHCSAGRALRLDSAILMSEKKFTFPLKKKTTKM